MTIGTPVDVLDKDFWIAHRLASTWVAGFWGAVGAMILLIPSVTDMENIWWLGPLMILMAASFAIARFTNQPGADTP